MDPKWACLVVLIGTFGFAQDIAPKVSVTRWPQDRTAAISLTFDDGINTDLDFVGPILRKHHLNGTFFVTTRMGPWEKRKPEWKLLAQAGDELANHTVHHPCLLPQITPHSQDYTPEMMEAEIRDAAEEIVQLANSQRSLTFAYPCGNMSFGKPENEVKNAVLYARYVSEHAFAARAVGNGAEDPDELNVLAVKDLGPTAGKDYLALLELGGPAIRGGLWGVYCFHGVGGDWLSITPEALDELTTYLEHHPEIWTATFGDVLRYIQERKAASIQTKEATPDHLALAINWPLDKKIYDLPLTLKIEGPFTWTDVAATGDGKPLQAKVAARSKTTVVLVDVPAQTTLVRIANLSR
jgi:peptidoglycan/xylan/chitin deacetylase (PgdA/CDA1 family)